MIILICFKQLLKKWKSILNTFLSTLGIFTLIYELTDIFFPKLLIEIDFNKTSFFILLGVTFCLSIILNFPTLSKSFIIKNRDINIKIVVGDMFKIKGAKVIPTNTTFDTTMKDDFISTKSIQGQFQIKYFKNDLIKLDSLILKGIDETKSPKQLDEIRETNNYQYQCGTVSKIKCSKTWFYFLAIADVNKYGKPIAKYENILVALEELWSFLIKKGHMESLVIPIIGTGKTGIAEATRMSVIKSIITSFVAISTEVKIIDELIICIHPSDIKNNKLDIDEIFNYAEYISKYKYDEVEKQKYGKPL